MSAPVDAKAFLVRTPFFGGLDDAGLDRVIALLNERSFGRGAEVFREGDTGRSMFVVAEGELVATQHAGGGRQVKLMRMKAGDFFGETTLIEMQPRFFTAVVDQDARLYELTAADLYKLYRADVKSYVMVLQNVNRELCRRLRTAGARITELADDDDVTQIGLDKVRGG